MKNKIIFVILLAFALVGFVILKNKNNLNQKPLTNESLSADALIEEYLNTHILEPGYGGKVFCVFHKYGSEEKDNQISYYLWTYCEEYYKKGQEILMGAGVSMPVRLNAIKNGNQIQITDFKQPIDGEDYPKSIREMFPEKYSTDAINGFNVTNFSETPKEKANLFYKS
jgi:hypothetical protein